MMKTDTTAVTADDLLAALEMQRDDAQRDILMRFFKTAPGQYGEGDMFLGLKVPQTRAIVKEARLMVPEPEIEKLLLSQWHEARLCGLLLLVEEMKAALPRRGVDTPDKQRRRKEIADFYLRHATRANNWDLVDLSCEYILGPYILHMDKPDYDILYNLARKDSLWEQRISIVTTFCFIREGIFDPTLRLADMLSGHPHDLIHKAVGWMLREVGKRDRDVLLEYLEENHARLPRTALRYAIEKLSPDERRAWLNRPKQ